MSTAVIVSSMCVMFVVIIIISITMCVITGLVIQCVMIIHVCWLIVDCCFNTSTVMISVIAIVIVVVSSIINNGNNMVIVLSYVVIKYTINYNMKNVMNHIVTIL